MATEKQGHSVLEVLQPKLTDEGIEPRYESTTQHKLEQYQTHIAREDIDNLTEEHRQYLLNRWGTLELDPIPDMNDNDPLNWPLRKKQINLVLVAFHAMMATFTAACIQAAFEPMSVDLGVSLQRASYLTSLVICVIGVTPLLWRPLADRFGRRPIFLISLICSFIGNIGCANSPTYATMALCRAITAFFICPAAAVGSAVVAETFFRKERAKYMGLWTLMVTLGVPLAPFLMGFVAQRVGYRWIYYIVAIVNIVQLVLYAFLGPETRYLRKLAAHSGEMAAKHNMWRFGRIDPTPLRPLDFIRPLALFGKARAIMPAFAYAMIFLWQVMITIEIPQVYVAKFGLNTQQIGLQFLAVIVGSIMGEFIGGRASDWWMSRGAKNGQKPRREHRLWLAYIGFLLSIVGVIVFFVQTYRITSWNITPLIGVAIAAAGNQIVTTVLVTYVVDCYLLEAASVGVFITFVRQMWGFIGPFWFPLMIADTGYYASAGIATALMVGFSVIPTVFIHMTGSKLN